MAEGTTLHAFCLADLERRSGKRTLIRLTLHLNTKWLLSKLISISKVAFLGCVTPGSLREKRIGIAVYILWTLHFSWSMRNLPAIQTCTQALLHRHLDWHWSSSHLIWMPYSVICKSTLSFKKILPGGGSYMKLTSSLSLLSLLSRDLFWYNSCSLSYWALKSAWNVTKTLWT